MKRFQYLAFALIFASVTSVHAAEIPGFIPESQLSQDFDLRIAPVFRAGETSTFTGKDLAVLNYRRIIVPDAKANLLIVHGFNESEGKYSELAYIFSQAGYNVHIYEQRGFGQSDRLLPGEPTKAWVRSFDDYVVDMNTFFSQVYDARGLPTFVFAHSMGAVVTARYMQQYPNTILKAVFSSPMIEPNSAPYPALVAKGIAKAAILAGQGRNFALGQDPFPKGQAAPAKPDSSSDIRVDRYLAERDAEGYTQMGATWSWVYESLNQTSSTIDVKNAARIKAPILVFQATEDKYVNPEPQVTFCKRVPNCRLEVVKGSEHAIFYERDEFLVPYLEKILSFLQ